MFSSGAGSWAAAKRVAEKHGTEHLYLVFSDVKGDNDSPHAGEDEDNYRFLQEAALDVLGEYYDTNLIWLKDGRDVWQVFKDDRFLGNSRLANCSKFLKQIPARKWLEENCVPEHTIIYVGIDWTETHRVPAIVKNYLPYKAEAPLTEEPFVDKEQVLADLRSRGIEPPRLYEAGYAHANCGGFCVRAGQGQFAHLLKENPERYAYHEAKEEELRQHLGKDVAILRDRRGGTSTPLTLRSFRERAEKKPDQLDLFDIGGCGCFVADEGARAEGDVGGGE